MKWVQKLPQGVKLIMKPHDAKRKYSAMQLRKDKTSLIYYQA